MSERLVELSSLKQKQIYISIQETVYIMLACEEIVDKRKRQKVARAIIRRMILIRFNKRYQNLEKRLIK